MNFRFVINQLGLLLIVLSAIMLGMALIFIGVEWWLQHALEPAARNAMMLSGGIGLTIGGAIWLFSRGASFQLGRREAFILVALTWLLGTLLAALPYLFWAILSDSPRDHPFRSFTNCFFEGMSGLTTTGATVLTDIEAVPRILLLWRALTQWLGGLGIVVLFVAVLPAVGTSARKLFRAEVSGVTKQGVRPQIRDTARFLWYIYLGLTVAQAIALRVAGMDWFDSICHTFSTVATGGFSTRNASVAAFNSAAIEGIIIIFMILGGVNFAIYYQAFRGRLDAILSDPELRLYVVLHVIGIAIVAMLLYGRPMVDLAGQPLEGDVVESVRQSAFTFTSIRTTSGFATADWDDWTSPAVAILFIMGLVGGCAGSTSGGLKIIRLWILVKTLHAELERAFRPSVIRPIRVGNATIGEDLRLSTLAFFAAFLITIGFSTLGLMILESHHGVDLTSAASASLACMTTIGPGLGLFGAIENYGWLSDGSKWMLCFVMLVGRLEVFSILVLFSPRFWRNR